MAAARPPLRSQEALVSASGWSLQVSQSEATAALAVAEAFLVEKGVRGRVLMCRLTGSTAYGLAHAKSDKDYVGVYAFETEEMFLVEPHLPRDPLSTLPSEDESVIDVTLYEVGQFANLLLQGNPFCIEALFSPHPGFETSAWRSLRALVRASDILSALSVDQFLSYSRHTLDKHSSKKRVLSGKRIYHSIRLLYEARRIVRGGEPLVKLPDGPESDELKRIRADLRSTEEILALAKSLMDEIESLKPWPLPDKPNYDVLNDWAVKIRLDLFEDFLRIDM